MSILKVGIKEVASEAPRLICCGSIKSEASFKTKKKYQNMAIRMLYCCTLNHPTYQKCHHKAKFFLIIYVDFTIHFSMQFC